MLHGYKLFSTLLNLVGEVKNKLQVFKNYCVYCLICCNKKI